MCKAKEHTKQLKEIIENINRDYEEYKHKTRVDDLIKTDIEHEIEFSNCNASEGYMMYKALQDVLKQRRVNKDEFAMLQMLKQSVVDSSVTKINSAYDKILAEESKDRIYKNRVMNGEIVYDNRKSLAHKSHKKTNKVEIKPNARIISHTKYKNLYKDVEIIGEHEECWICNVMDCNTNGIQASQKLSKKFVEDLR